jgi:hypothetical protein
MIFRLLSVPLIAFGLAGCSSLASIEEFAHLPKGSTDVVNVGCLTYATYEKPAPEGGSVLIAASAVNQAAGSLCSNPSLIDGLAPSLATIRYASAANRFVDKRHPNCRLVRGEALTPLHSRFEFVCL